MDPQAVLPQDFSVAFLSAAMVILCGGCYAAGVAWARLKRKRALMRWAYLAYGGLLVAVVFLTKSLHLAGFWNLVVAVMVVGYGLAPHAIWFLCIGTHREHNDPL